MIMQIVTCLWAVFVPVCLAACHGLSSAQAASAKDASNSPAVALEPVVTKGLVHPVYVTEPPDGSGNFFVAEQAGRIRIIKNGALLPTPFLDISKKVLSGGERGLLGIAFHPDYRTNGRYVVNYTRVPDGATVVAEYRVSTDRSASQASERMLMTIPDPYPNHNGGMVEFGPDGMLYIATGDGGSRGDPENRGQNRHELLGKILRIDVDHGSSYAIPPDNPFAAGGGRPEIFAYGLRNPWRFSFDRHTGDLWAADVGQNAWEEIDIVRRGGNYGWRIMEGNHCFSPKRGCTTDGLTAPVAEYATQSPRCSITGGYVYRGDRIPALRGTYLFGDYCSGELFWLPAEPGSALGVPQRLLATEMQIASFGQDRSGEVYVVDHRGGVYRLIEGK